MRHAAFDELREQNPVPEELAPPPIERLIARLDEETLPDREQPPRPRPAWRRASALGPVLVSAVIVIAIAVGSLALLHLARRPLTTGSPGLTPLPAASGRVRVRIANGNNRQDVTNGGVSGRGHFKATGAISDTGTVVTYRWAEGALITLRYVTASTLGTITYVVKINTGAGSSRWTITSATGRYKGLHGRGTESENPPQYTISILKGTVSSQWLDAAKYNGIATFNRVRNECAKSGPGFCAVFGGPG